MPSASAISQPSATTRSKLPKDSDSASPQSSHSLSTASHATCTSLLVACSATASRFESTGALVPTTNFRVALRSSSSLNTAAAGAEGASASAEVPA
eukprot:7039940-Prymnesium_polylepis.1